MTPLIMAKDFWINSQLSIARFYGGISISGKEYRIVKGSDDLVLKSLMLAYRKLGRDKIIELVKQGKTEKEIKETAKKGGEQ